MEAELAPKLGLKDGKEGEEVDAEAEEEEEWREEEEEEAWQEEEETEMIVDMRKREMELLSFWGI